MRNFGGGVGEALNYGTLFLIVLGAGKCKTKGPTQVLVRILFLPCQWLMSHYILTWWGWCGGKEVEIETEIARAQ